MPTSRLYQVLQKQRAALLANERDAASEMVRTYGGIWQRLRSELDGLLEGYARAVADGEDVTGWLFRQERLETLLRQTQDEMRRFSQYAERSVTEGQSKAVEAALRDAQAQVRSIGNMAGASFSWVQLPSDVIEDLVGFASNGSPLRELLERLGSDASLRVRDALTQGVAQGLNPEDVARSVRDAFGGDLVRALRVSRTETLRAYREATRRSYEGNSDVIGQWVWIAACTPRTCAACWAMSGTLHPLTEQLESHPNCRCFPSGTLVSGPTPVSASMRYYTGELVTIRTASGIELSFTPNHPILTRRGWVSGGLLQEGDDVISSAGRQNAEFAVDVDYQDVPTRIEDVVKSFDVVLGEVPTSPKDFHGDGIGSKVHVILSDCLLRDNGDAALDKPLLKQNFSLRTVRRSQFAGLCSLDQLLLGALDTPDGGMGTFGASPVFISGSGSGAQLISSGLCAQLDSGMSQADGDNGSHGIVRLGEIVDGLPCQVAGDNFIDWERASSHALLTDLAMPDGISVFLASEKTALLEFFDEWAGSETVHLAGLLGTKATEISLDRIVHISRRDFAGHVYNLQTKAGWYISNGIITHNCTMAPIVKTGNQWLPQDGTTQFAGLEESAQRSILGPLYELYESGKIDLRDVVGERFDRDWGLSRFVKSAKQLKEKA